IGRLEADRFLIFTHHVGETLEKGLEKVLEALAEYRLPFKITCNIGIYVTNEELLSVEGMIDRAVLAQSSIKGSYTSSYKYYTESMRKDMLGEQEIAGIMGNALEEKQFVLYYQPQYNHANGMLIGAEALVRWIHPERGMISPGVFIPIFEKNGFITKLDLYVFERVCEFVRRCIDTGLPIVPVSSNFSRYDIFQPDFVAKLETIRKKYDVPTKYLRIEITESVVVGGSQHTNEIIRSLHECGYIVEMDDFGSGYSSLNVLKDIELDIIKLDMMFLSEDSDSKKGGTILSSMVRMAKWLGMPVIAEGVEHLEQADFLKSIGCEYIQGYLYSRPLPEEQYIELLSESVVGTKLPQMELNEKLNAFNFWDPKSQETLIFSNYVGGAAIFEYQAGKLELLRVNEKYLQELGMRFSEKEVIGADPMKYFDDSNKKIFIDMLDKAIETGEEEECETWRNDPAIGCPEDGICIRSNVRMVGKSNGSYLFYAMIRNITKEKRQYEELMQMLRQTEKMD
ncbi:MAG: EAL domain-containing protein, partial [Eubacterium sp.]|nr:EAL domain-containing protein [Eubacterium sp.]